MGAFTSNAFSQNLYVGFNTGASFSAASQRVASNVNETTNYTTTELKYGSFGKGFNFGGMVGYNFTKYIAAEISLSYLIGAEIKSEGASYFIIYDNTFYYKNVSSSSAKMFRFNPSIVISAGYEKINPYAKIGFIAGIGSINTEVKTSFYGGAIDQDNYDQNMKSDGGMAFGFSSSLGVKYALANKISLFGELALINMSYAPTKGKLTKYNKNGADLLAETETYEKEFKFVDRTIVDKGGERNHSEPTESLKATYPLNSVGLNIGLVINL